MKKTKTRKTVSAAELMACLQSDPEWVLQNQERRARYSAIESQLKEEQRPLLIELAEAGVNVNSVWDLVNMSSSYSTAIPVLSRHLRLPYHSGIREGIARALTVEEVRGTSAAHEILEELIQEGSQPTHEVRWALANALTVVADASMKEMIKSLADDARYQDVSEILKLALTKLTAGG
jgi:hypothetical protein